MEQEIDFKVVGFPAIEEDFEYTKIDSPAQGTLLCLFDILGFSNLIATEQLESVIDLYSYFIARLQKVNGVQASLKNPEDDLLWDTIEINKCFFSDTVLFWISEDDFSEDNINMFFHACTAFFHAAIERKIPLRGTIAMGEAIMDKDRGVFLGSPLVEAAKGESAINCIGLCLCNSMLPLLYYWTTYPMIVFPFKTGIKPGGERILLPFFVNWLANEELFDEEAREQLVSHIDEMNKDERYSNYYENTESYITSLDHKRGWATHMPPPLGAFDAKPYETWIQEMKAWIKIV